MQSTTSSTSPSFDLVRGMLRGFGAGIVATTTMSGAMLVLQRAGLLGRMPPRVLTDRTVSRLGLRRKTSRRSRRGLSALMHFAFGGAMGAAFEIARTAIAARRGRAAPPGARIGAGVAFGALVWGASYAGWIPALRLMPWPSRDRPARPMSMLAAHGIYGATLAAALSRASGYYREAP